MTAPVVPAHTLYRQHAGRLSLVLAPAGLIAHVIGPTDAGDQLMCTTKVRNFDWWDGQPVRVCQLCATAAVPATARGRYWKPTPAELAAVHLHAAWDINAAAAARVGQIRSQAIADGSALVVAESLEEYRAARGLPTSAADTPAHRGGHILGAVLGAAAPQPVATVADDHTDALRQEQRLLELSRVGERARARRQDLADARRRR